MAEEILHKSLTEKVYEKIKDEIMSSSLKRGERLVYENLGKDWGVSLTPWREAIIKLKQEGLISKISREGFYVKSFSEKEIKEIYEIREWLEGLAIHLIISRITEEEINILLNVCNKFKKAVEDNDKDACIMNDFSFHENIVKFSKNEKLYDIIKKYNIQLISILKTGPFYFKNAKKYLEDHYSIIEALRLKDIVLAEKRIRNHIGRGKEAILEEINKQLEK